MKKCIKWFCTIENAKLNNISNITNMITFRLNVSIKNVVKNVLKIILHQLKTINIIVAMQKIQINASHAKINITHKTKHVSYKKKMTKIQMIKKNIFIKYDIDIKINNINKNIFFHNDNHINENNNNQKIKNIKMKTTNNDNNEKNDFQIVQIIEKKRQTHKTKTVKSKSYFENAIKKISIF